MSRYIAIIMKEKLFLENVKFDYILFVPLHKSRIRKRGFNQAQKIAKYLSKEFNIPVIDCVIRKENTKKLCKLKKEDRKNELKNAFEVKQNKINLENKNVILVDDIFTTGSTVNEISRILKLKGVKDITVLTFLTGANNFDS